VSGLAPRVPPEVEPFFYSGRFPPVFRMALSPVDENPAF
jgi:hypothetical protein